MRRFLDACRLAVLCLIISACQSSPVKDFSKIKFGMEKHDVLEAMGNPRSTQRFHGKDRWTYVFYDKQIRFEKEVHFFEGNAVYVGDIWQPTEENSAPSVDKLNAQKNQAADEELAKEIQENRKAYQKYEDNVKGTTKPLYVPQFQPLQ